MQITLNIIAAVFIGLIILVAGNYLGLLEGRSQGYKKRRKEEADEMKIKAGIETPLPTPTPPAAMPAENSLLKLSLDKNNQPQLDLHDQRVNTSQLTPKQRGQLIDLITTMRAWAEDGATQSQTAISRPLAAHTPPLSKPLSASGTLQTPPPAASASQPRPAPIAAAPALPPKKDAAPASMVAQIDAILQENLSGTPLDSRGIRLSESLTGGVIVTIGTNRYESIAEVPDAEVLAAIRGAVAQWEKKYTPG
ncbi:MAG: hypothetical protein HYR70_07660 [Chloroflexi bacterium]|nr:hypothetical protein [Chloroflexota bacterium]MBI3341434.1 hypothetical protein [Chloroflexota bacterium]